MNILISPAGIIDIEHPGQGTGDLVKAGFQDIFLDLSICCSSYELEQLDKMKKEFSNKAFVAEHPEFMHQKLKEVLERFDREQIKTDVVMAPAIAASAKMKDVNPDEVKNRVIRVTEESIKLCGQRKSKYIVIKPWIFVNDDTDSWKVNRAYFLQFARLARENHVMILLMNQCKDLDGHLVRGICSDEVQVGEWIDALNAEAGEKRFGFCMDAGTCNLCGQNMHDFVCTLGERLKAVIIRDCDGNTDSYLLPFTSVKQGVPQTDWLNLIRGLRKVHFDGQLIMNCPETAASFSPIIRPSFLLLMKSVADFFSWQIGMEGMLEQYPIKVLFGAGNMCRNYMKCYGEQYPPLFTCDNNQALWGTQFCGLEVKSPGCLRELPDGCAVLICNIYYREIEKQLRDMGIKNPVVFFNDEYMPSFYFTRLER